MPAALLAPTRDGVAVAGRLLRTGGLVAFPTETVYGLGADATAPAVVARVFDVKRRPGDNPLIVHLASVEELGRVAASAPPLARHLARAFWPGPITMVLEARPELARATTAGLATVAVRVPGHPLALAALAAVDVPVAAPSANRSGRPSPTTAAHVVADLGDDIDAVLDGGACRVGVESTVVDVRGPRPVVLREGAVTREQLGIAEATSEAADRNASPGTRHRHYTPTCDVRLAPAGTGPATAAALAATGRRVGLVAPDGAPRGVIEIARFDGPSTLATVLYGALRDAETAGVDVVVVEAVPEVGVGRAVMDRLRRATA